MHPIPFLHPISSRPGSSRQQRGSTLVMALFCSLVLCTLVASMLALLQTENRQTFRSSNFAQAFYLAEAGAEEGFVMLSKGGSAWATNGWTGSATNYIKTVTNVTQNGSTASVGTYAVTILNAGGSSPQIISTGTVANSFLGTSISRVVKVTLTSDKKFQFALRARGQITLSGNAEIDSFDSSDTTSTYCNYNSGNGYGTYNSSKTKDQGNIASNGGSSGIVRMSGNAGIFGDVNTGPGGTITDSGNAFVGYLTNYTSGVVDPARVSHTANYDFPAAPTPFTSGSSLGSFSLSGSGSQSFSGGGGSTPVDFVATRFSLSGNSVATFSGYSRLYINGNLGISGNAKIVLNAGAKLEIYITGTSSLSGNGVQNNAGTADRFQLYSTGSSVSISGNGNFTGAIYAPDASFSLSGNGTVIGSFVASTMHMSGNGDIHYDEALQNISGSSVSIASWQEL